VAQAARGRSASATPSEQPAAEISLGRSHRLRLALLGIAIGIAGLALVGGLGLLFTSAVFGYSIGALV
jgi:hypothetical protein